MIDSSNRIIQSSPGRTGSTLLTNILYGLFYDNHSVFYSTNITTDDLKKNFIIKTHQINIDYLMCQYAHTYDILFVCSERPKINQIIDEKYKLYNNVIVFQYEDLLETETNSIKNIVNKVYEKLQNKLNSNISRYMNIDNSIKRIKDMNNLYQIISTKSFDYYDAYFHIHGSHRNRNHI